MDILSEILKTLRLNASVYLHSTFCNSWAVDVSGPEKASFHVVSSGDCWLHLPDRQNPVALHPRDLVVVPRNAPHILSDSPEFPSETVPRNQPASDCITGPSTTLICGHVEFTQDYWNPLVNALPEYVILSANDADDATLGRAIDSLIHELETCPAGADVVINRLSDILFVQVVRSYMRQKNDNGFLCAIADPKVSHAVAQFHLSPGGDWSVQTLATMAGMSRSSFADRFNQLVGMPPMHYVTRWRMQHAQDLLTTSSLSLAQIAQQCGYQSDEALSRAFKKQFGKAPGSVRRQGATDGLASFIEISAGDRRSTRILYTPDEAWALVQSGSALLIDVRDREAYEAGHIPGAVNIPEVFYTLSTTTPDGLQEMQDIFQTLFSKAGLGKHKTAIVYEDNLDTRYGASCRGYFQLAFFGHPDIGILDGGFENWEREGLPVTTEHTMPKPVEFLPQMQRGIMATKDDMIHALSDRSVKILDNRDKAEWLGRISSPPPFYDAEFTPRKGRIPGARWIEWHNFMDTSDGIAYFKSPDQIRTLCAQAGLYTDDDIIIYCFKGARASNTYIALRMAGFKHVRNYYGSWNEWSRDPAMPVLAETLVY
jgi:thiosulfate/3-mercaptopyruvate sulfurtransferase